MGNVQWTEQQLNAITSQSSELLVSAGAGSGKTAVLIERLLRKIKRDTDPLSVNRLLLVTYTNEAAGQLKEKIRKSISDAIAEAPSDKHLNRQYLLLPQAKVTTIHGFCLELVKKYHAVLGLPPKLKISNDIQANLLKHQVADSVIDNYYSALPSYDNIEDFVSFADNFITLQDKSLTDTLIAIYDKLVELPDGIDFLKRSIDEYGNAEISLSQTIWGEQLLELMHREYSFYLGVLNDACEIYDDGGIFAEKLLPDYEASRDACRLILECIYKKDWDGISRALPFTDYNGRKGKRITDKSLIDEKVLYFKEIRASLRDASKEYLRQFFDASAETVAYTAKRSGETVGGLHKLLSSFDAKYSLENKKRGIVDFSDIIRLAHNLLIDENGAPTEVAKEVAAEFDEVCIDEYQDVNQIQDDIFNAISASNNRFMVGDIKQSIYGFRGSMPEIFAAYRESECIDNIDLNANFRCDKPIIDFSNAICRELFTDLGCTFKYRPEDDLVFSKSEGGCTPVEVICIDRSDSSEHTKANVDKSDEVTPEISYIAKAVKNEIDSGRKPSEIAILAMTKSNFKLIQAALASLGINSKDAEPPDLLTFPQVIVLLCILQAIDNPSKEIQLVGALKSPVYDFTMGELAEIRRTCPASDFYQSLVRFSDAYDFAKGKFFLKKLNEYRSMINEPVDKLIWHIIYDSGLMYLAEKEGGENAASALLAIYELGRAFESGTFNGLYNFLRSINETIESGGSLPAPTLSDSDDVVKIMTVHKSKGLEFEVVILCDAHKAFSTLELRNNVLINTKLGVSLKLTDSTGLVSYDPIFRKIASKAYLSEQNDERIRCLYVALTRAKNKLIVVGTVKNADEVDNIKVNHRYKEYGHGYVFSKHPDFLSWIIISRPDTQIKLISADEAANKLVPNNDIRAAHSDSESSLIADKANINELVCEYKRRLSYTYPYEISAGIPAKLSVSKLYPSILDEYDDSADVPIVTSAKLQKPRFVLGNTKSGTDVGTATHQFMQFCSFEALKNGTVEDELKRLTEMHYLDSITSSMVNIQAIAHFKESELLDALLNADVVKRELRFNIRLSATDFTENNERINVLEGETVLVQGIIDCIFSNGNGEYNVLDYKTDSMDKDATESEFINTLIDRHKQQLSYYYKATKIITGKDVDKVLLYSFALGKAIVIPKNKLLRL